MAKQEQKLCACGCGTKLGKNVVAVDGKLFIFGHQQASGVETVRK
jgi:hypothetical protein